MLGIVIKSLVGKEFTATLQRARHEQEKIKHVPPKHPLTTYQPLPGRNHGKKGVASPCGFVGADHSLAGAGRGAGGRCRETHGHLAKPAANPWGAGFGETILLPNGTFSKTSRIGELFTRDVGRYTVGPGYIHFSIADHEPKIYKGVPMRWVRSETVFFRFMGPDQLSCEDRIIGTRWVACRVRQ